MPEPIPDVLRRAINHLVLDQEFFASLLLEMKLVEVDDQAPPQRIGQPPDQGFSFTMGTDGSKIYWSRRFVSTLNVPQCVFVLAHEVCHPMLLHLSRVYEHGLSGSNWTPKADAHGRLVSRDPLLFNIAGDYLINDLLKSSGFTVHPKALLDAKYSIASGWTTEKVYDDLLKSQPSPQQALKSLAQALAGGSGTDLIEPSPDTDLQAEADEWKDRIVRAAAIAKSRGTLPAALTSLISEYTEPQYPVWHLLERYVDSVLRDNDYSWHRPRPSYMNVGIIMPDAYSERVSRVDVWYDTSGSVDDESLSRFHRIGGDIIRNACPAVLALGQCDAGVHSYAEIKAGRDWPTSINITGRGGTSFQPPFTYLAERQIRPSLLIYLTDLEGDFPAEPPPYPVLWVSTSHRTQEAPFGTTIHLNG